MGKHTRRSTFGRNAAIAGATVASVTALTVPAAGANPVQDLIDFGSSQVDIDGIAGIAGNLPVEVPSINSGPITVAGTAGPVSQGQRIVSAARSKIGSPYAWGAAGPNSFDCSGLTSWAYKQVGKAIPRTSQDQAANGTRVSRNAIQPGDIIAFYSGATHVGIFSGGGKVIHAPNSGDVVKEAPMDYMPYHSAVRY
ncbi:C40 family peptidase [Corynebacterium sphenisci]|uniref:C40 family peptidase n=1 Tax=Corynebacterium sphenisci TaxID=191493 RepID=UPI0026E00260|nr:C40 family peptidase [Corynebacterium sphenisci]MDO5731670.1 C40 family peptidase [Corynebacterium sphenisci]